MTSDDEYDGAERLRRALSLAASAAPGLVTPVAVDPVAARRAGDARARTRTAVTTSLAFSLVILAGLGSVYFAAHRSRPSSLGSDQVTSTPTAALSPSAPSAPLTVTAYTDPIYPIAGRSFQLFVTGTVPGELGRIDIRWGDGGTDAFIGDAVADSAIPFNTAVFQPFSHSYLEPGNETPLVIVTGSGSGLPERTSFALTVLPAPSMVGSSAGHPGSPRVGASAPASSSPHSSTSARPTGTPAVRPTQPVTRTSAATPSSTATPTSKLTPTPTARATATPTPTVMGSATAGTGGSAKPTPVASSAATGSQSGGASSAAHQSASP